MLVRRQDDANVFRGYVERLTAKSTTKQPSVGGYVSDLIKTTVTQSFQSAVRQASRSGVCIRCGEEIPFNPNRPFVLSTTKVGRSTRTRITRRNTAILAEKSPKPASRNRNAWLVGRSR